MGDEGLCHENEYILDVRAESHAGPTIYERLTKIPLAGMSQVPIVWTCSDEIERGMQWRNQGGA